MTGHGRTPLVVETEQLLVGLDATQREAVRCEQAPLAIVAGPGSGKTRVLTRRIAWRIATGAAEAPHVLALTFTRHAAGELTRRLEALTGAGVTAGTLHAVALAQLRRRAARRDRPMPALLERKVRLLLRIVEGRGAEALTVAAELASEIEWAKARLLAPDVYAAAAELAGRTPARGVEFVAESYARYERDKRRARLVDFDDLLWWCGDALETDDEFAAEQQFRFRHLFVDEFQDVSPAQLRLVRAWLAGRPDLTVVGDPDQAIFSFAGADPTGLTRFARAFPGARVVHLDHNYRSTPEIVSAAEALLADAGRRRPMRRAAKRAGPAPSITDYDDDDAEAAGVAQRVRAARAAGRAWSSFAVLYRTNAQSAAFEAAFAAADVPYRVRGDARFLDRPEVRAALDVLRAGAARVPGAGLEHHLTDLELDGDEPEAAREHRAAVARLGREYLAAEPDGSLDGFLAWLTTALRNDGPPAGADAVELLTFHRAKGLEFRTVFVTGLERGLVPIARADTPAERAEERRLLYVALTRAEETLELSWARRRTLGTRVVGRAPSSWLAPIEAAVDPTRPVTGPAEPARTGIDAARDRLASSTSDRGADVAHPEVLAALVEWRRGLARASSVPAFVIFHDTTLRAIADALPSSRDALLAVPGMGPVKIDRYADAVLGIVRAHASPRIAVAP
jgi:DNA helicase-2/ATP-dependent DNA helicase PcrA